MPPRTRTLAPAVFLCVLALLTATSCSTVTPTAAWGGDGIHEVDGYWILAERPCDMASADLCVDEMRAAEVSIGIDPRSVVRRATASLPNWRSVGPLGQVSIRLDNRSGLANFVVLDLADGSRRVVGIVCPGVRGPDGSPRCGALPFDDYRVGASPSF